MVPTGVRQESGGSSHLFNLPLWIPVRITTLMKKQEHSKRNSKEYLSWNPHTNFFSLTYCEKKSMTIKGIYFFLCVFTPRITPHSKNWTLDFEPAFLQRFEPTIHFSDWSAVSHPKTRDFRLYEPAIPFYHLVSGFPS